MSNPIYYICHKYTGREQAAFDECRAWCQILEVDRGLTCYSPIRESHPQWQWIQEQGLNEPPHEYWLQRDLRMMEGWLKGDGYKERTGYWCNHHGETKVDADGRCQRHLFGETRSQYYYGKTCMAPTKKIITPIKYDSGLIVLVARNAYEYTCYPGGGAYSEDYFKKWLSNGARQEYEWAQAHYVRCCDLETFVETGELVDI